MFRPADTETTALGAAYAAGLAIGMWTEEKIFLGEGKKKAKVFQPNMDEERRNSKYASWHKAVSRTFNLSDLSL